MAKKMSAEELSQAKKKLITLLADNKLSLGESVRMMRKITGMNQKDYALKIIDISPRILSEIEQDKGNPTLETLNKIGRPFGYKMGFVNIK